MSTTKVTGMMQTSTKGGDISSASPTVIDTDGDYFDVTGTTNFAAFTVVAGRRFTVQFDGILTMTHHATTLDLPGGANITTAAGDVAEFFATGTNTVQCVNYTRASGAAVALADNSITLAKMAGGTDGQIITYDASGNPVAVGPGSDGEVLTSTGAGSPPAFEAAAGGGKILQVLGMSTTTAVQNNTSTHADTGVTLAITPSATSSKIIVMVTMNGLVKMAGNVENGILFFLLRDATNLSGTLYAGYSAVNVGLYLSTLAVNYLDAPSSTSALTYKMTFRNNCNCTGVQVQTGGVGDSSMVLVEVGA